jgi:hypothetical protein
VFPRHVFARSSLDTLVVVLASIRGVKGVVNFHAQAPELPEAEILNLREIFGADEILDRPVNRLSPLTADTLEENPWFSVRLVAAYDVPAARRVSVLNRLLRLSAAERAARQRRLERGAGRRAP